MHEVEDSVAYDRGGHYPGIRFEAHDTERQKPHRDTALNDNSLGSTAHHREQYIVRRDHDEGGWRKGPIAVEAKIPREPSNTAR